MRTVECKACGHVRELGADYTKKCPHGQIIDTQACYECFPDLSWIDAPVTQKEYDEIMKREPRFCGWERSSPYPMQYRISKSIVLLAMEEYGRMKGWR